VTTAFDFVVAGVVSIIAIIVHRISLTLFAPGTVLWGVAADATTLGGASKAWLWFQILAIWGPLLVIGGVWLWVLVRAFRRQASTTKGQATRRP